jgi:hypothetical protein
MPNQQRVPLSTLQGDREADVHFGSSWMLRIGPHILSLFLVDGEKFVIYLQEAASHQRLQKLPFPHYSSCTFKASEPRLGMHNKIRNIPTQSKSFVLYSHLGGFKRLKWSPVSCAPTLQLTKVDYSASGDMSLGVHQ